MHFSPALVILSILVATFAGYMSLDLTQRALRAARWSARRRWVLAAAGTMGLGIWSMHFLGMLALDLDRPVQYRLDLVGVSMLAAVMGAGVSLWVVTRPGARRSALFTGAGFMGAAVGAMHYSGMASMEVEARMTWNVGLVGVSVVVAYGASLFALWIVFAQNDEGGVWALHRRVLASLALGLGVAGLHYLAMEAVTFHAIMGDAPQRGLNTNAIAAMLVIASTIMLVILLFGAQMDQRRAALANDLAVVAKVMREIGRSGDARESISRAICELTGATMGGLMEPDGKGNLVMTGGHGIETHLTISLDRQTATGDVFLGGARQFISQLARDATVDHSAALDLQIESALYEPVILDEEVVGVLFGAWTRRVKRLEDRSVSVTHLLAGEAAFVIERADLMARLERLARTDELTGLANRRTADEELGRFLARARRDGEPLAVAMLDIDHFKRFNDTHGHAGGDRLLQAAAEAWTSTLRGGDLLARYGGEEFIAFFPRCPLGDAGRAADRLREALPEGVTCSVGVALWNRHESGLELLNRADAALYEAKSAGRDRTVIASEPTYTRPS